MTPAVTGCQRLPFDPSLSVAPDVIEADTPSGYELDLNIPQPEVPEGLASADLEEAAVTLPEGVGVSLSAADGLQACTDAQAGLGSQAAVSCPDASKIGTVEKIHTPLLANPLQGAVYLFGGQRKPVCFASRHLHCRGRPDIGCADQARGRDRSEPAHRSAHDRLARTATAPDRRVGTALLRRRARAAEHPSHVWPGHEHERADAVERQHRCHGLQRLQHLPRSERRCISGSSPFSPIFQVTSTTAGVADAYGSLSLLISRTASEQQLGAIAIQAPPAVAQLFVGMPACREPQASEGALPAGQRGRDGRCAGRPGLYPADLNGEIYLTGTYGSARAGP